MSPSTHTERRGPIRVRGETRLRVGRPGDGWLVAAVDADRCWRPVAWTLDYEWSREVARWLGQYDACTTIIIGLSGWEPGAWEIVTLHKRDR